MQNNDRVESGCSFPQFGKGSFLFCKIVKRTPLFHKKQSSIFFYIWKVVYNEKKKCLSGKMKVGETLNYFSDYLFWRLAHYFVVDHEYRIIAVSQDEHEFWLEKRENKFAPLIRLYRYDLDWSNWLQQDIERTAARGESIRKRIGRGQTEILNVYVSTYPPVDDYEFRIEKPFSHQHMPKTAVRSMIIDQETYEEKLLQLEQKFFHPIHMHEWEIGANTAETLRNELFSTADRRLKEERSIFEQGKPFFTYIFIAVQIAVFLMMEFVGGSMDTNTLIQFGAKYNPLILEGEWWRFITPMFLHIGILHLIMNTFALYYLGMAVERIYGRFRFFLIYFFAGFAGSVASFLFSPQLSAGASGAIFGCFGALLFFGKTYPKLFARTMGFNILIIIAINLALGFSVPGIDNAAHIGGLVGGFLGAALVHFPRKMKIVSQFSSLVVYAAAAVAMIGYGFNHPSTVVDEQNILVGARHFIELEQYEDAYSLLTMPAVYEKEGEFSATYYFLLSFSEIHLEKYADAEKHLLKTIKLNPEMHEAYYNLSLLYLQSGQEDKAIEYLEKAVRLNPDDAVYKKRLDEIRQN